ncbi:uncharacterized protein LOC108675376 [Hyalella azteca]|uniref:Uncharacterized protein LOC108675376 n=1 Tax=Hyalella azteca TaxID=294128 RepID=A0A8B7NYQ3_HYAAZ|nr:uncharacterized protein LOC108675376 [Hyalella azteca]XP_047736572.1 uncharacterized protein LOC108675376 [Hyalella azteca]
MEVVTAAHPDLLPPTSPYTDPPAPHQLHHQDPSTSVECEKQDDDEEEEDMSRMETDGVLEEASSPCAAEDPAEEESSEVLRAYEEHMECDDTNSMFIDEDSSSSRVFPDNDTTSTDSLAVPQQEGRRNKRKNFLPRNIVYNPQDETSENHDDEVDPSEDGNMCAGETYLSNSGVTLSNGRGGDSPLDLSETPVRRSLLPRRFSPINNMPAANVPRRSTSPLNGMEHPRVSSPVTADSSKYNPNLPDYAQLTMRRLLGLYGLPPHPDLCAG